MFLHEKITEAIIKTVDNLFYMNQLIISGVVVHFHMFCVQNS